MSQTSVSFDVSSIDKIRREPELVLADIQGFWQTEAPYIATKKWEPPGYPLNYKEFERIVSGLAAEDEETRVRHDWFVFAERIIQAAPDFRARGLHHVRAYLPEETVLEARVLLACFIFLGQPEPRFSPNAFVVGKDIVINASSKYWDSQVPIVLHELVHELVHVGYHCHQRTLPLEDAKTNRDMVDHILWQLQNEGLATYVAYRARTAFPTPKDQDYRLLDDNQEVKRLLSEVNGLLQQAMTKPPTEIRQEVIERGISQRAFYVVGAHMARQIEEQVGKQALVSTVRSGASDFASMYEAIAQDGWRLDHLLPQS
jgi:hypothetical protein